MICGTKSPEIPDLQIAKLSHLISYFVFVAYRIRSMLFQLNRVWATVYLVNM